MANHNDNSDVDSSMDGERIGPMEIGYILFTAPFILFVMGIVLMVVFNVR